MSRLNKDTLFLIFEELQDDSKSLFSSLMVNRLWCETVTPILWKNPWNYNVKYKNKSNLFTTIASYLPNDIKEFLKEQGVQLSSISHQSLLFDYLSFCKSINIYVINEIISIGSPLAYNQFLLQQEFYNIFIRKCSEFKYLNIKSIKHQIFYFLEAKNRLESLYELKCDTSIDSLYFYGLARFCQNIQRFIIVNVHPKANHGIIKLIEVQKNLKYFEWEDDFKNNNHFTEVSYEGILELKKKADNLNYLKISFQHFRCCEHKQLLQGVILKLYKLKTLIIESYDFYFNDEQLKRLVYRDLEILNLDHISLDGAINIIESSGGLLKEVVLKTYDLEDNFDEKSLIFIRKIYENCPLIEYLSLKFPSTKEHFTEFEELLKVCQNLKSLLIFTYHDITYGRILKVEEEFLKVLIRSAPTNLRELRFYDNFVFSLKDLEKFLEKWRGRPALTILTSYYIYQREDYKKLLKKYKNEGVINNFRCDRSNNLENMHFKI